MELATLVLDNGATREWTLAKKEIDLSGGTYYHDWRTVWSIGARDIKGNVTAVAHDPLGRVYSSEDEARAAFAEADPEMELSYYVVLEAQKK